MRDKGTVKRISNEMDNLIKNVQDNNFNKGIKISYTEASRIAAIKLDKNIWRRIK